MPAVKLRGTRRPVVRAHGLRRTVRAARDVEALDGYEGKGGAAGDLGLRLREAGEFVAAIARSNASWSDRIPGSVRVGGGRSGVVVRAGNRNAPHAYSWEIPGVEHPVFGRPPWVVNGTRRFMLPAAEEGAEGAAAIVARVIEDWAREYGFTELGDPSMQIEWNGGTWFLDTDETTVAQAFVIKDSTKDELHPAGRSLGAWNRGLAEAEPSCVRAAYWLMLQQAGQECPIAGLEFPVVKFNNAFVTALKAEQEAEEKRREAEEKAEAERQAALAVPTRAASPAPGYPPATTPMPQPGSGPTTTASSPTAT